MSAVHRNAELKETIRKAERLVHFIMEGCDCWEGCNDREGKLPCPHDIVYEGVQMWAEKFNTAKKAEY